MDKKKRELSPWGKQCKMQMIALGKSLTDISKETKLSRTYISGIINGRLIVPEETIRLINQSLQINELP